ncbi:protein kinase domain-containing protein [Singulisphaera sp. PoT]|uniref:protein kinase domain-containing protein n=1 Tax=Singulisphaera sp. PoT TaxID=3411797 RepID=UPI003BF58AB0
MMTTDLDSGRDPLDELAEEFAARYRRGERPSLAEYVQRYPELADEIREIFPALVMLEDVRPGTLSGGGDRCPSDQLPFLRLGEYRIVREIGRGGMGVVYEAEQESLGRRVAIKVLPPGALGDPRQVERFRREARAAARLHHTNLVPLFGVGEEGSTHYYVMQYIEGCPLDDVLRQLRRLRGESTNGAAHSAGPAPAPASRPATAAASQSGRAAVDEGPSVAVAGGSLSSAEVARSLWTGQFRTVSRQGPPEGTHSDASSRPDLSPGGCGASTVAAAPESGPALAKVEPHHGSSSDPHRPYLRSVAHLGIQVADALEYAAGQGILHRDVKPSNLLLDRFGTVWLTDFGLAKATGTQDLTHTGDLFGTLRYMAPERFQGRSDIRSDVYALGLTLYELLALRPAFDDRGQAQLVRHITLDEPPKLDALHLNLPRDLITIVHKATAKDPGDRYQTPGALAEDLRRFLEDRPILARRLNLAEQAWRWSRRSPAAAALAALLLVLAGMAVVAMVRAQQERLELAERQARLRLAIVAAIEQAGILRNKGLWAEASTVLSHAELRLDDAREGELEQSLKFARAELDLVTELEKNRMDHRIGIFGQKSVRESVAKTYGEAFDKAGFGVAVPGQEFAVASRIDQSKVKDALVAALDDWAFVTSDRTLRERLLRVAQLSDKGNKWSGRARDPANWGNREALEELARDIPEDHYPSPQLLSTLGVLLQEAGGNPEPLLRAAQQRRPADFWLNFELGMLLRSTKPREAVGYARAALVARPESGMVHNLLGMALWADRRPGEAKLAFQDAIRLDSETAAPYANLGAILTNEGRLQEALDACKEAVKLDPRGAIGFENLGNVYANLGRPDEALAAFRKALELDPRLPTGYNSLGNLYLKLNRRDDAVASYRKALEFNPRFAAAHHNIGNHLADTGRPDEAIEAYRRAIEFDPPGVMAHKALGETLIRRGRDAEAAAEAKRWLLHEFNSDPKAAEVRNQWKRVEHLLAIDARLPAILEGKARPADPAEEREIAGFCLFFKKQYVAASRFYASAFTAEPDFNDAARMRDRYNAACAAALAATGQGADAGRLDEPARSALREQALGWLQSNLDVWIRASQQEDPIGRKQLAEDLRHWQRDSDLAGIRDTADLARVPEPERLACRRLWDEVGSLLARAEKEPTAPPPSPTAD